MKLTTKIVCAALVYALILSVSMMAADLSEAKTVQNIPAFLGLPAGAKTPFITIEAEWGEIKDARIKSFKLPIPKTASFELEASGASYVRLEKIGAAVSWINPVENMNAVNIRSCLPDRPAGGGMTAPVNLYVDGIFRQSILLSSKQAWQYRTKGKGWINDPNAGGMPFDFYNEDRAKITGDPIQKGTTITLQLDKNFEAEYCLLDCIDLEHIDAPFPQPENSLSIVDFGADPTGKKDAQEAITKCITAAKEQNKTVWIPAGRFRTGSIKSKDIDFSGLTVEGAGMWYSMLYQDKPNPLPEGQKWRSKYGFNGKTVIRDFSIGSSAVRRGLSRNGGGDYAITGFGEGWLVERIWVQHCAPMWMSGSNGTVRDCRIGDSWGDAINLNNSNRKKYKDGVLINEGVNLSAVNNFVRGNGDDGIAVYSDGGMSGKFDNTVMKNIKIINNTSVVPYWANTMRIAGGIDVELKGNFCYGSSANCAITISIFGKNGNPMESAVVEDNVFLNGGGWNGTHRHGVYFGSHKFVPSKVIFRNNIIMGSRDSAVSLHGKLDLILENNTIINPAKSVFLIHEKAKGTALVKNMKLKEIGDSVQIKIDNSNGNLHFSGANL